jgi:transposase
LDVVLRQPHRAGEKMFVDYAGQTMPVTDAATGQVREAQIFVAALGASGYAYAEPSWSQDLPSWIGAHCRVFEFFGGVPQAVVADNLKAGVTHPCRYEPDLNPTYRDMASHYGTAILPTRPRHPQDNAKAEVTVQIVERQVLARLRNRTFFSLAELAKAIGQEIDRLNSLPFQKIDGTRRSLYETVDKPALRPLPPERYEFAQWKRARVNIDYHVEVARNYYSVPHSLIRQELDVRLTATVVEVLRGGRRVASHRRVEGRGRYVTDPAHMPAAHRKHLEWSPSRLVAWAATVGPTAAELVETILRDKPHPEQGYRACLGLMSLGKRYGAERMEAAARRALDCDARSYRSVKSILAQGLDRVPVEPRPAVPPSPDHANVRGPVYYSQKGAT